MNEAVGRRLLRLELDDRLRRENRGLTLGKKRACRKNERETENADNLNDG